MSSYSTRPFDSFWCIPHSPQDERVDVMSLFRAEILWVLRFIETCSHRVSSFVTISIPLLLKFYWPFPSLIPQLVRHAGVYGNTVAKASLDSFLGGYNYFIGFPSCNPDLFNCAFQCSTLPKRRGGNRRPASVWTYVCQLWPSIYQNFSHLQ